MLIESVSYFEFFETLRITYVSSEIRVFTKSFPIVYFLEQMASVGFLKCLYPFNLNCRTREIKNNESYNAVLLKFII